MICSHERNSLFNNSKTQGLQISLWQWGMRPIQSWTNLCCIKNIRQLSRWLLACQGRPIADEQIWWYQLNSIGHVRTKYPTTLPTLELPNLPYLTVELHAWHQYYWLRILVDVYQNRRGLTTKVS